MLAQAARERFGGLVERIGRVGEALAMRKRQQPILGAGLDAARATQGTGLGLALVKAVADLHGMALTLGDAKPGLRVTLEIPRVAA